MEKVYLKFVEVVVGFLGEYKSMLSIFWLAEEPKKLFQGILGSILQLGGGRCLKKILKWHKGEWDLEWLKKTFIKKDVQKYNDFFRY